MTFLEQMAVSILSFFCAALALLAFPFLFVGDLLNLPSRWLERYRQDRALEILGERHGVKLVKGENYLNLIRRIADRIETADRGKNSPNNNNDSDPDS